MKDEFAYYLMANSGMFIDDRTYDYKQHLNDLREFVVHGGRLIEFDEATFDFPRWLSEERIPYHFEWVELQSGVHTMDALFVLHVYDADHAFDIRMRTNKKPLRSGWREQWMDGGFDKCCRKGSLI